MKITKTLLMGLLLCFIALFSYAQDNKAELTQNSGPIVDIFTNKGVITVLLYDETPLHRNNFLKLVAEGFYNNMLYHRIINGFIIQIGDPKNRKPASDSLNYFDPGEKTIAPEIQDQFYHRRGALNAARMGEAVNPYLESSVSHFTIIQGKVQNDSTLLRAEKRMEGFYRAHLQSMYMLELGKAHPELTGEEGKVELQALVDQKIEAKMATMGDSLKIPEAHRQVYKTLGGAPHLDHTYTVFGEVLAGMDVVDSIASVPVEKERPLEEVYIIKMQLRK